MKNLLTSLLLLTLPLSVIAEKAKEANQWRSVSAENAVVMELSTGKVVIELAPEFSPNHVIRYTQLVKQGFYDGESFYRVIDGFVAQAGPQDGSPKDKSVTKLNIEETITTGKDWSYTLVQENDLFAPQVGFKNGFAVGHSPQEKQAWLLHCPGVIAMARESSPNTATSHFYITNGQAPRYLDKIMTVFGRVVYGMEHVQAIQRTSVIDGDTPIDKSRYSKMLSVKMMADLPEKQQIKLEIQNTDSATYKQSLISRKKRENAFFYKKPPPVLDICQTPVKTRLVK